jgi:AcrR family transcriptional regulator
VTAGSDAARADARRNRTAILTVAAEMFRRDGPGASLEEIARRAGVGSATLHRHFRGRQALLREVFAETVRQFAAEGERMSGAAPAAEALWTWLELVVRHCAEDTALASAVGRPADEDRGQEQPDGSWQPLEAVGSVLLARAVAAGSVRPDVSIHQLLTFVDSLATACAGDPEQAARMLDLLRRGADAGYLRPAE